MMEWDLTILMAVLNWAVRSRDEHGRPLLDRNPLKGLRKPREKNPTRVVLAEEEYQALLPVSREVGWQFHVALVLTHETGHRIGAIRDLRWWAQVAATRKPCADRGPAPETRVTGAGDYSLSLAP